MQTKFIKRVVILMVCGVFLGIGLSYRSESRPGVGLIGTALAQEPAPAAPAAEAPKAGWDKNKKPETFWDYWRQGGITMWPLLGTAIWATAVFIELLMRLRVKFVCPPNLVQEIYRTVLVKDYQKAWKIAKDNPSVFTRIFAAAIEKLPDGREAVDMAAVEAATNENNMFKSKNAYINLNATVAPLLGLFGTISGMVSAFNSMAFSGAVGDPSKLAGDIGEALITTYSGLVIAIPALFVYYLLGNRIKKVMEYVQRRLTMVFEEIKYEEIPADLVIVTKEMKLAYLVGDAAKAPEKKADKKAATGKAATGKQAAAEPPMPAEPAKAERVPCPNCSKEITVGVKKCPHCNTEMDWE